MRLLDGECLPAEQQSIREHLRECAECRRAADELERLSQDFSNLLQSGDSLPAPSVAGATHRQEVAVTYVFTRRWTRMRILRAAAVVALIITAIGVSPARAWLVDGWQAIRSLFSEESAMPPEQPTPVETPDATAVVSFAPAGTTFSIEVSRAQSQGVISLVIDSGPSASARVRGGDGSEELVVLPAGLRIVNAPTSSANYEIVVPRSVRALELTIAGRTVLTLDRAELLGLTVREIDLTGAPPR